VLSQRRIVAAAVAALLAGCAARDDPRVVRDWPPRRPSSHVSISVIVQCRIDGMPDTEVDFARESVLAAFAESRLFSNVEPGLGPTDLQAEVTVTERDDVSTLLTLMSGLTLVLLPFPEHRTFTMATTLRDAHGAVRGTEERTASLTSWVQLFLLAAPADRRPARVARTLVYDLARETIVELRDRRAL
jgi:hypothetical protein